MTLFSARTLKFLWASVPVMCGSWNLQSLNLHERSASALRRTRPTASLHPLPHLSILAKSHLTVSASSVLVEAMFNLGVDPPSEEECTGGIPRQHYYVYSRQLF